MGAANRAMVRRVAACAVDAFLLAAVLVPPAFGLQQHRGIPTSDRHRRLARVADHHLGAQPGVFHALRCLGGRRHARKAAPRPANRPPPRGPARHRRALARTAIKLIPWELTHLTLVGLSVELGSFTGLQIGMLWVVYARFAIYVVVGLGNRGERSVHDLAGGTLVRPRPA